MDPFKHAILVEAANDAVGKTPTTWMIHFEAIATAANDDDALPSGPRQLH